MLDFQCETMIRPLPPALQEIAERELNEKPNRIESDILALREWLAKQPHLQTVNPCEFSYISCKKKE